MTQIVDVNHGQLLDIVPGRDHVEPCAWFAARPEVSSSYRAVYDTMLRDTTQAADPFHIVRVANTALESAPTRVQNETLRHRGRKTDPLYSCRRRLVMTPERLGVEGHERLVGLLAAGDHKCEVWFAWNAKRSSARSTTTATNTSVSTGSTRSARLRRRRDAARGGSAGAHHQSLAAPDRRLAPGAM